MILINSSNIDTSTNDIIDWLIYLKKTFVRINDNEIIELQSLSIEDGKLKIKLLVGFILLDLDDISSYFYRRGFLNIKVTKLSNLITTNVGENFAFAYLNYVKNENNTLINFVKHAIENRNPILNFEKANINKLDFLNACTALNIKVPETAIVNSVEKLNYYKKKWGKIITKPIDNGFFYTKNEWFYTFTNEIEDADFIDLETSSVFHPTLIQKKIQKKFEIRAFYFKGKIFSNAIFSQNDIQTSVDFRRYNRVKPNRNVAIEMPITIKNKINLLMSYLKLETGSFDIIYSFENDFLFLEVNPIGQFSQVSTPSNYYLEKFIAESI